MTLIEHYLVNYLKLPKENHVTHEISNFLESKCYEVDIVATPKSKDNEENIPWELRFNNNESTAFVSNFPAANKSRKESEVSIIEHSNASPSKTKTALINYNSKGVTSIFITNLNKALSITCGTDKTAVIKDIITGDITPASIEYFIPELKESGILLKAAYKEFSDISSIGTKSKEKEAKKKSLC